MANENKDVIRVFDTPANLNSDLRNGMFGYDTTNDRLGVKRLADGTMVYFENSTSTAFIKVDGTNSPTAAIDWDGQNLNNVGNLDVDGTATIAGDTNIGALTNEGSEKYTDTSFADALEWQVTGDFSVTGGKMQFTQSSGIGSFYQQIGDMVTAMAADTWYVLRLKFDVDIPDGGKIVADIISDASYTTTVASFDGVAANEYTTICFKTQAGETNPYVQFSASGIASNFSITDISIKDASGVLEVPSYGRFQNGLDFGTGNGTGPNDFMTVARIAHDQEDSGNGDTLRIELVQSNAVLEISTHEGLKRFWTKGGSDPNIKMWPNVGASVTPKLEIYGYKTGDSQRTMSIGIDSTYNNTGFIGNSSTALSTLRVGADKILMNTTAGIKYDMFGGIGLGYQTDTFEVIGADADTDYRWGYGTSGSLTERMYLDGGTGALKVAGQIGTTVPMDDTVSVTSSGLTPRFHLEDVTETYNTLGRIYTLENDSGAFSLYYGKTSLDAQGGVPTDLTRLIYVDSPESMHFGGGSGSGNYAFGTDSDIYFSGQTINAAGQTNGNATLILNEHGYLNSTTQFRDLQIDDGKEGLIAFFDGSSHHCGFGTNTPNYSTINLTLSQTVTTFSSSGPSGYEAATATNTDNNNIGVYKFVNTNNADSSDATSRMVSSVSCRAVTSDSNAGEDSGGKLEFRTKPESDTISIALTLDSSQNAEFGNDIILNDSKLIRTGTSDSSDDESIYITGAGGFGVNRGAYINLHGNEATNGAMFLYAGNTSGGDIIFNTANLEIARFGYDGVCSFGRSTNYSKFEDDGTLVFNGNATTWEDVNIDLSPLQSGGTSPGFATYGGIRLRSWAVGDDVDGTFEIPHAYKLTSTMTFHIHFLTSSTAPTGTDYVKWQIEYWIVDNGGDVTGGVTTIDTGDIAVTAASTRYDANFTTTLSHETLGGQLGFNISRVTATGDAYTPEVGTLTAGVHFEQDMTGSRQITTK